MLDDAFGEILELADAALEPQRRLAGFSGFGAVGLAAANSGLRDIVAGSARGRERAAAMRARLRPKVRRLVARAHAEGGLRTDFTAEDVPLLFWGTGKVIDLTSSVAPEIWQRYLGLLLDGLRAGAVSPLPVAALTPAQLDRISPGRFRESRGRAALGTGAPHGLRGADARHVPGRARPIVATALPKIVADLRGFEHLSWVVTAYLVTSTVTVPLYGKLSDIYGRRRLFVVARSSIFMLGSALLPARRRRWAS